MLDCKYCMCKTCEYENCHKYCDDCHRKDDKIHDIWTCTKYERKPELRELKAAEH